jgi:hypothetical protein
MNKKSYLLLSAVILAGCRIGTPDGPRHEFASPAAPASLTEELAIAKAREVLILEVDNTNDWQLPPSIRGHSTNWQEVVFVNSKDRHLRTYEVQLEGSRIICYLHGGM